MNRERQIVTIALVTAAAVSLVLAGNLYFSREGGASSPHPSEPAPASQPNCNQSQAWFSVAPAQPWENSTVNWTSQGASTFVNVGIWTHNETLPSAGKYGNGLVVLPLTITRQDKVSTACSYSLSLVVGASRPFGTNGWLDNVTMSIGPNGSAHTALSFHLQGASRPAVGAYEDVALYTNPGNATMVENLSVVGNVAPPGPPPNPPTKVPYN